MNVSAVSSTLATASTPAGPRDRQAPITLDEVKKVSAQFEAILVRQLLKPAIEPLMQGGMGGAGGAGGAGGGIYGYLLTDVLAGSLSQGRELGFARLLERQLTPDSLKAEATASQPAVTGPFAES